MYQGVQYVSDICTVDGTDLIQGILEGDDCQLSYQTTLRKPSQEKPGVHGWMLWRRILKILTQTPNTKTNKLQQKLGKWVDTHSECGKWLLYQDHNRNFYARETHKDIEQKVYKHTNKGTQLTCIDTTITYQPTKYSIPVSIHISAGGKINRELGAELKVDKYLPEGLPELSEQLLADQPEWIRDLIKFVRFTPDGTKYGTMETTINYVLKAHDKDGYLVAVSDGSVKHMHQMNFD